MISRLRRSEIKNTVSCNDLFLYFITTSKASSTSGLDDSYDFNYLKIFPTVIPNRVEATEASAINAFAVLVNSYKMPSNREGAMRQLAGVGVFPVTEKSYRSPQLKHLEKMLW